MLAEMEIMLARLVRSAADVKVDGEITRRHWRDQWLMVRSVRSAADVEIGEVGGSKQFGNQWLRSR